MIESTGFGGVTTHITYSFSLVLARRIPFIHLITLHPPIPSNLPLTPSFPSILPSSLIGACPINLSDRYPHFPRHEPSPTVLLFLLFFLHFLGGGGSQPGNEPGADAHISRHGGNLWSESLARVRAVAQRQCRYRAVQSSYHAGVRRRRRCVHPGRGHPCMVQTDGAKKEPHPRHTVGRCAGHHEGTFAEPRQRGAR